MADFSFSTKEKLKTIIKNMNENIDPFIKRPGIDFSRNRKILFSDVIHFLLSLQSECLDNEMLHFFSYSLNIPTSSAMIQSRSKIKLTALEHIFHKFVDACPVTPRFRGYHLLAVDGSKFTIPENKKEPLYHVDTPNTEKGRNVLQLNAIYHLNSGIFKDVLFQEIRNLNEHSALITMLDRLQFPEKSIIITDRGYESYNTLAHIENKGLHYVIRGRQGEKGIISGLNLPKSEEFDVEYTLTISKKNSRLVKQQPALYKRIRSDTKFDFFSEDNPEYLFKFRVIKIKITDTLNEILFTNLTKDEMPADDIREIYRQRWEIETAFSQLKYTLGAIAVHSKKAEYVLQELYAKIIMYNYCKIIVYHITLIQNPSRKYVYQANLKQAVDICMKLWSCPEGTAPPEVEKLICKFCHPIRTGRSSPRASNKKRSVLYFTYRIA